jgi:hypothetical protein
MFGGGFDDRRFYTSYASPSGTNSSAEKKQGSKVAGNAG